VVEQSAAKGWPEVAGLVPHAGPMRLIARVLAHDESSTTCEVVVDEQALFRDAEGRIPSYLALEYMAQCVAAHAGLQARAAGESPRVGFLVGSRRLRLHCLDFGAEGRLEVRARHLRGRPGLGAVSFACEVNECAELGKGRVLAEGNLSIAIPAAIDPRTEPG
jgi:predicted hotdog family 3-hydroxylacyl-ACP dehydratase